MSSPDYREIIDRQKKFFASGGTRDLSFRVEQLKKLRRAIVGNEAAVFRALKEDLNKPAFEAFGGETGILLNEIDFALKRLRSWAKPKRVRTPLVHFPAACLVVPEPFGVALIIGPWNFPVQLMLCPLVGAVAAGNCAVLKPSIAAPATSALITRLVAEHFDPRHVISLEGGAETARALLEEQFDYIFYTGGSAVGRAVMQAAAGRLTPVTLELGGKNPCIVDADVDLDVTARRIVWGKFFNAGQSCVAVDYLLVHRAAKDRLIERMKQWVREFYGDDPAQSPDYARIVNEVHFNRLTRLLGRGTIVCGGRAGAAGRYIAPTIIDNVSESDPVMEDEIFGPILPVISYEELGDAIAMIKRRPKPLALYFFSRNRELQERVLRETSSGGCCINDVVVQETIARLPFGGVGMSGIGAYHGKAGFDTFSHQRSIVRRGFLFDLGLRYPPYRDHLKIIKKLF